MRVCPRRHRNNSFSVHELPNTDGEIQNFWCKDCGAYRSILTSDKGWNTGWHYPEITSILRGRKGVNLDESGVYKAHSGNRNGGDPNGCGNSDPDRDTSDNLLAEAGI